MASQTSLSVVQSLYVAFYGRPADPGGLAYWAQRLEDNGGDAESLINAFGNSLEYVERFSGLDENVLVNNLYRQLFGRDAEAAGRDFYVGLLSRGEKSLAEIALTISNAAQGSDGMVFRDRVEVANAFTSRLDSDDEVAAYSTARGIGIGQAYLNEVTTTQNAAAVLAKIAATVATLLPVTPGNGGNTGGGNGGVPAPALTLNVDEQGVLTFGGTAQGTIVIGVSESKESFEVTFTRGAAVVTLDAENSINFQVIELAGDDLEAPAAFLQGPISGTGNILLQGVEADHDFSQYASELNVVGQFLVSTDITAATGLGRIDTFLVAADAVLTLSAKQYEHTMLEGSYVLKDNAEALLGLTAEGIGNAQQVTVTSEATLAQLAAIEVAHGSMPSYESIRDTASLIIEDAASNDGTGRYITAGKSVIVSDEIDIAGLDAVNAAVSGGSVFASDLQDSVAHLLPDESAHAYVSTGTNVVVTDAVSVAQVATLDAANGDGNLTYDLVDSYTNVRAAPASLLAGADSVQLTDYDLGEVSVAEVQGLLAMANLQDGVGNAIALEDLTYTLADSANALASGTLGVADIVTQATTVTATTPVSVSQAVTLHGLDATATYSITDSAYTLANGDAMAISRAVDLVVTGNATAAQAQTIVGLDGASGDVTYSVIDYYANLVSSTYAAVVNAAVDVSVNWNGYISATQAQDIINLTNTGVTSIPYLQDTAAAINSFVSANVEGEKLSYDFRVYDSATNITTQIGDGSISEDLFFITGNAAEGVSGDNRVSQIQVTGTFAVDTADIFWNSVNTVIGDVATTAWKTYYQVDGALVDYTNEVAARDSINSAERLVVRATAAEVYSAQSVSDVDHRDIFSVLEGGDSLIVSGSDGYQYIYGSPGGDSINAGAGSDTVLAGAGNDVVYGNSGYDTLRGGDGADSLYGGSDADTDYLYGDNGRDTLHAGDDAATVYDTARYYGANQLTGGEDGDHFYASAYFDIFRFEGMNREALIGESGTTQATRDYIEYFSLGDKIYFAGGNANNVQFFSSGSANAAPVEAGALGLSIRYEKDVQVQNWLGNAVQDATRILIDVADNNGQFDDVADMHIILVGSNIDINWDNSSLVYGG